MADTIRSWADARRVRVALVKQILRVRFPDRDFRSPDRRLTTEEVECLVAELAQRARSGALETSPTAGADVPVDADDDVKTDPILGLDIAAVARAVSRGAARTVRFHFHPDFFHWITDDPPGPQRAAVLRALESIVANGRPNRVKGVRGVNQGWLRTPVGGTSGMQWYLWYAGRGSKPIGDRLREGEFLIRAVRHHDATADAISAGRPEDWMPWSPHDLLEEYDRAVSHEAAPLTGDQLAAARCERPVQIVRGTPGAGKTTAILHGVRRLPGRVLYLTYGRALAERARSWLRSFASSSAPTLVESVGDVLATLAGGSPRRDATATEIQAELGRVLGARTRSLGPWCSGDRLDALLLFDELHAQVLGRASHTPDVGLPRDPQRPFLPVESAYVELRREVIGESAARAAWRAASYLDETAIQLLFPGPVIAHRVIERVGAGTVPQAYANVEWIVVDEAQDLTVLEAEALVEFARAVARASGKRPGLRFAGDEGQTLRPTGFTWADLKVLLARRVGEPETSVLDCNLRSAREVALFVEQLTRATYPRLRKGLRPGGQRRAEIDPVEGGEVAILRTRRADLPAVLEAARSAGAVIQPGREVSPDVVSAAESVRLHVHTGENSKGLDFDSVVVLGLGETVAQMHRAAALGEVDDLAAEQARSLADHARVAASRAVSRLVLVEFDDDGAVPAVDAKRALDAVIQERVEGHDAGTSEEVPETISTETLAERLEADTGDAIGRLVDSIRRAEHLVDREPRAALDAADEAAGWLRRSGRTAAVGDELRQQVHRMRGRARAAVGLTASPLQVDRDLLGAAQRSFRSAGDDVSAEWMGSLVRALRAESGDVTVARLREVVDLAEAVEKSPDDDRWLFGLIRPCLRGAVTRAVAGAAPTDPGQARAALDLIDRFSPETDEERALCDAAAVRLLNVLAKSPTYAQFVLDRIRDAQDSERLYARARALSTLGDPGAPDAWVRAGDPAEGLATLRRRGRIKDALAFAERHGLGTPPSLSSAGRVLDALAEATAEGLEPEELSAIQATVSSVFPEFLPVRGRRGVSRRVAGVQVDGGERDAE